MQGPTISEAFTSYSNVNVDLASTTLSHTKRALDCLTTFLTDAGRSTEVACVSRDEVDDWKAWMIKSGGYKPSSINSYVRSAAPVFRWLTQRKNPVIRENPFQKVKYLEEDIPVYEFTKEEVGALIEAADPRWKGIIILACGSGMARGEVLNATWADFDAAANTVTIRNKKDDQAAGIWEWKMKRRGKERRPVQLPMSPKMGSILMELQSTLNVNQPYPFVWGPRYWDLRSQIGALSRPTRNCPDSNFDTTFKALCVQAGVEKGERDFHDLRKTAITNWARTPGMAPRDVQHLARHSTLGVTERYLAVNPAVFQIAQQNSFV